MDSSGLGLKLQDPSGSYLDSPGSKAVPSSPLRAERGCLSPSLPGFFMDFSVDVSHQRHVRCFCHLLRPHFFQRTCFWTFSCGEVPPASLTELVVSEWNSAATPVPVQPVRLQPPFRSPMASVTRLCVL